MLVDRQRGFFLLEALVAGLSLLVMASCFLLYARSVELGVADGCRVRAVFLARAQFAAAQADANGGRLSQGSYPWQGLAEDLQDSKAAYQVETEVSGLEGNGEGTGLYKVMVHVAWQGKAVKGQLDLEREVVRHGQGSGED